MSSVKASTKHVRYQIFGLLSLVAMLLAACGEVSQPTATPAATSGAASTTAPASTTGATSTTIPSIATSAPTAPAATVGGLAKGGVPVVAGATEISLDSASIAQLKSGMPNANFKMFASTMEAGKFAESYNTALTAAAYQANLPLTAEMDTYLGIYKGSDGDLMLMVAPLINGSLAQNPNLSFTALTTETLKKLSEQLKDKKSIAFVVSGIKADDLLYGGGSNNSKPTGAVPTTNPVITNTQTAATNLEQAQALNLDAATLKKIAAMNGDPHIGKANYQAFVMQGEAQKVAEFYQQSFQAQGFSRTANFDLDNIMTQVMRWSYSKDNQRASVLVVKFNKDFGVKSTVQDYPELNGKLKVGDTLVVIASGERE